MSEQSIQEAALFRQVNAERPALIRYFTRNADASVAEDLASEAISIAWCIRESYDPTRGEVAPWLQGIATKVLHRHRRDTARRLKAMERLGSLAGHCGDADDFTEELVERLPWQGKGELLRAALSSLGEGERCVAVMRIGYGLEYGTVASKLAIKKSTARCYLRRAQVGLHDWIVQREAAPMQGSDAL